MIMKTASITDFSTNIRTDFNITACPCGSGKTFDICHGVQHLETPVVSLPVLAPPSTMVKWDLGCGQSPSPGFEGVDLYAPDATHKFDLCKFPWPREDNSVDELYCSHFVEHIPCRDVEPRDLNDLESYVGCISDLPSKYRAERWIGQDMAFAFFDEAYRILKPGGTFKVIVPALQTERAFQDPTHRRFIPPPWFMYLSLDWRKATKLDHYRVSCDFQGTINHTCYEEMNVLHPEAAARRFREGWNTMVDIHVVLVSKKT